MRNGRLVRGGAVVALLVASVGMTAAFPTASLGVVVGVVSGNAVHDWNADVSPQAALERDVEWAERPMSLN